jgi:hypothetical protein
MTFLVACCWLLVIFNRQPDSFAKVNEFELKLKYESFVL